MALPVPRLSRPVPPTGGGRAGPAARSRAVTALLQAQRLTDGLAGGWFRPAGGVFHLLTAAVGCQKSVCHAAQSYSWISPPRTSRRRSWPTFGALLASPRSDGSGDRSGPGRGLVLVLCPSADRGRLPTAVRPDPGGPAYGNLLVSRLPLAAVEQLRFPRSAVASSAPRC
jgi:hypothetical protein